MHKYNKKRHLEHFEVMAKAIEDRLGEQHPDHSFNVREAMRSFADTPAATDLNELLGTLEKSGEEDQIASIYFLAEKCLTA